MPPREVTGRPLGLAQHDARCDAQLIRQLFDGTHIPRPRKPVSITVGHEGLGRERVCLVFHGRLQVSLEALRISELPARFYQASSPEMFDARRDWGYAPEHTDAMWRMLQADERRLPAPIVFPFATQ